MNSNLVDILTVDVAQEIEQAIRYYPPFTSPHEGYALLLEEVDELWDVVKKKQPQDKVAMKAEAVQVAAMAVRFIMDCCNA